jgi:excisionase family DNA binding protein
MSTMSAEPMVDLRWVAELLHISTRKVWRLIANGDLPKPVKVGRAVRFFMSEISQYQEKLKNSR